MLEFPKKWFPGTGGGFRFDYDEESGPEWAPFAKAKEEALLKIRGMSIGETLLQDLQESTCKVEVLYGKRPNAAGLVSTGNADKACYLEVADGRRLRDKLQMLCNDPRTAASAGVQGALRKLAAAKIVPLKDQGGELQVPALELGPLELGKVAYWVMDHLTPGPGADVWVIWQHDLLDVSGEFVNSPPPAWAKRPHWVALAHELIHAWRIATGRVVFHPTVTNYYEEAMTVGLPPYDRCAITENRFRECGGEPHRSFYGPTTRAKSETAQKKYPQKV
jgi:hypothetical protein